MFSVLTIFAHVDFNWVRISKWLLSIASVVLAQLAWGLIAAIGTAVVLFAINSIFGFLFFRKAVGLEKNRFLQINDSLLLPPSLSEREKEIKAAELAENEIWRTIKKNMGVGKSNA